MKDVSTDAPEFSKVKRGAGMTITAGVLAAVVTFFAAPPLPLGGWAVYARAAVSLFAGGIAVGVCWFFVVAVILSESF